MKKIIGLVIILVALVLGGYYAMGLITEKTVKHDLQNINKSNGVSVKIVDYKRGYYTSKALLDWRLQVPERIVTTASGHPELIPAKDYEMRMPLTIHHGPIIFADGKVKFGMGYASSDIPLPEKYLQDFNEIFNANSTKPQINLSIFVNYLNHSKVGLFIPAFTLFPKKGGEFKWLGLTSFVQIQDDARKIKGGMTLDGFQLEKEPIKAWVEKTTAKYNFHKSEEGLYIGDIALVLPSIKVNKKDEKLFELSDFDMQSTSNVETGLFDSSLVLSIDKIFSAGKHYGPGKLTTAIKNLDAVVLARIHQKANMQQGSNVERQQSLLAILPEVPKLLAQGAEFEISELSFVMPQGTIEGNLILNMPKDEQANPFELFYKIKGKGRIKVPADVVKLILDEINKEKIVSEIVVPASTPPEVTQQEDAKPVEPATHSNADVKADSPASVSEVAASATALKSPEDIAEQVASMTKTQLDSMLESGFIMKDGSYYVIDAELDKAHLKVNGKPFNPAMLKF